MSDPKVRWRVKFNQDETKPVRYELLINGEKVIEQSFVELIETLMQGQSSLRWSEVKR